MTEKFKSPLRAGCPLPVGKSTTSFYWWELSQGGIMSIKWRWLQLTSPLFTGGEECIRSGEPKEQDRPEPRPALALGVMKHTEGCCLVLSKHLLAVTRAWPWGGCLHLHCGHLKLGEMNSPRETAACDLGVKDKYGQCSVSNIEICSKKPHNHTKKHRDKHCPL